MDQALQEATIRRYFWWSVFIKGAISLAEMVGGIFFLFVPVTLVVDLATDPLESWLTVHPGNFAGTHLLHLANEFTMFGGALIGFYLFTRGLIKLGLVVALLKDQLWAYPLSLLILGLFIIYQIYEIVTAHSVLMVIITIFDLVVVYLVWREWGILRRHHGHLEPRV